VDGIVVQVEIAERMYNTSMPTKQAMNEMTTDVGRQPHAPTDFRNNQINTTCKPNHNRNNGLILDTVNAQNILGFIRYWALSSSATVLLFI